MSGLDTRYVLAFTFEKYFVDKDTGAPLEGTISFFEDDSRLTPKNVYKLAGTPPNYTYTSLGPTVNVANGVPTDDSGNNIAIYFLPYVIDSNNSITTTVELYYYSVSNSDGVLQFTREGQPNVAASSGTSTVSENFVPNGQFRLHNNLPATDIDTIYDVGQIRANTTEIAQGGWTFELTDFTQSTDFVLFDQNLPTTPDIAANPRYSLEVVCDDEGNEQTKKICLKFTDVNKFGAPLIDNQFYTYGFTCISNSSIVSGVQLNLFKFYGGNPSNFSNTAITTFSIPTSQTKLAFSFQFGDNSAKSIAGDNSDFLQIQIILPGQLLDVEFTDFYLTSGQLATENPDFGQTTDRQFIYRSLTPDVPNYDGFDLYLPMRLTKEGLVFDDSDIGKKEDYTFYKSTDWNADSTHVSTNLVLASGQQYETSAYSALGIPFARLQAKYWNTTLSLPIHGTGAQFMTTTIPGATNILLVSNNTEGAVTNAGNGSSSPGFTFATIHKETAEYFTEAYLARSAVNSFADNEFHIQNKNVGAVTGINQGTTTFTVGVFQLGTNTSGAELEEISFVRTTTIADNPGNPGKYFTFTSVNDSAVALDWYVWYQVSTETDPAPPGATAIKINLINGDTAAIIAQKTWQALNGYQETTITTVAASTPIPAGSYFNIYAALTISTQQQYVVWYKVGGSGTQPVVANAIFIEVDIETTDTAAQVASKTQAAMNMKYFAVPDYRGWFLRGWDNSAGTDPNARERNSFVPGITGDTVGTFELSQNISHTHGTTGTPATVQSGSGGDVNSQDATSVGYEGGFESRPINKNVNFVIRY